MSSGVFKQKRSTRQRRTFARRMLLGAVFTFLTLLPVLPSGAQLCQGNTCGPINPPEPLVNHPGSVMCGPPSSTTLTATPSTIAFGQSVTLQWSVTFPLNPPNCVLPSIKVDGQTVGTTGSMVVKPLATRPYALFVANTVVRQVGVVVELPAVVRIEGNTWEWKWLLKQALREPLPGTSTVPAGQRPGRTVLLAHNVDMDLTNEQWIAITEGVTLTSELPPADSVIAPALVHAPGGGDQQRPVARNAFNLGPRLYTRSRPKPLFAIECNDEEGYFADRVRISGFRLQGPHFNTEEGNDNLERGIWISSCTGIEISNMEISGWSGQAIYIDDPKDRISSFDDVKIVNNFIHHNQHRSGNGYGVDVKHGARASIERNVFDFNRHAIAAGGEPGVGYRAFMNLVLKGGGHHDTWYNEWTHQFDVHGDSHCPDIPGYEDHTFNCGNAGDSFEYLANAFQFTNDLAIKIRGYPRDRAIIQNNVFARNPAIGVPPPPSNIDIRDNFNGDAYGRYGICDFNADGRDDLFLATGFSWWYSSAGRREWRFLNARPEKLDSVGLGDFDGDGRCDVFAVHERSWDISKGGTSPFTSLGLFSIPFDQLAFGDFNGDGIQDIFRRAPDRQWSAISPGVYGWTTLQSSSFPLSALRFGDFDGNGITDVIAIENGRLAVSFDARTTWIQLNPSINTLASVFIANVDGEAGDDIVRYVRESAVSARWDISSAGRDPWVELTRVDYPDTLDNRYDNLTGYLTTFVGRFERRRGANVLVLDHVRRSSIYRDGTPGLTPYGLYAY